MPHGIVDPFESVEIDQVQFERLVAQDEVCQKLVIMSAIGHARELVGVGGLPQAGFQPVAVGDILADTEDRDGLAADHFRLPHIPYALLFAPMIDKVGLDIERPRVSICGRYCVVQLPRGTIRIIFDRLFQRRCLAWRHAVDRENLLRPFHGLFGQFQSPGTHVCRRLCLVEQLFGPLQPFGQFVAVCIGDEGDEVLAAIALADSQRHPGCLQCEVRIGRLPQPEAGIEILLETEGRFPRPFDPGPVILMHAIQPASGLRAGFQLPRQFAPRRIGMDQLAVPCCNDGGAGQPVQHFHEVFVCRCRRVPTFSIQRQWAMPAADGIGLCLQDVLAPVHYTVNGPTELRLTIIGPGVSVAVRLKSGAEFLQACDQVIEHRGVQLLDKFTPEITIVDPLDVGRQRLQSGQTDKDQFIRVEVGQAVEPETAYRNVGHGSAENLRRGLPHEYLGVDIEPFICAMIIGILSSAKFFLFDIHQICFPNG